MYMRSANKFNRCQVLNALLVAIFPGPKSPTSEQVQTLLKLFVDDLIKLYEEGVVVKTRLFPQGMPYFFSPMTYILKKYYS